MIMRQEPTCDMINRHKKMKKLIMRKKSSVFNGTPGSAVDGLSITAVDFVHVQHNIAFQ